MTLVRFYDTAADELLKFAVMITVHNGNWVFCKHKKRSTLEIPGGHREPGEDIFCTAKREMYEETGAARLKRSSSPTRCRKTGRIPKFSPSC